MLWQEERRVTPGLLNEPTVLRVAGDGAPGVLTTLRDSPIPTAAVGSTGAHGLEPLAMATHENSTAFYPQCDPDQAAELAGRLGEGRLDPADAAAVVDHDPTPRTLPVPALSPLAVGDRRVLGRCGWIRPTSKGDYEATGGFHVPREAEDIVDLDIVGRGWGDDANGESVSQYWHHVRETDGAPVVVVNAHGAAADRLLVESTPFAVLEGALVAATAVEATDIVVYVNEADTTATERIRSAATAVDTVAIEIVTGPDAYKAGEPTMALEAIEGNHRLEARLRPPGPAEVGLHGQPTAVHTPRTLVGALHARGGPHPPTRLFTIAGDVDAKTTVELPMDAQLAEAVTAVGVDGTFKAACVGGRFGGLTPDLDVPVSELQAAGLGTDGGVEVLNNERCIVEFVGQRSRFAETANCGRCVPCREGTKQLTAMVRDVYSGQFRPDAIGELTRVMTATSLCPFGVDAARPVRTAIAAFEAEFTAHANGTCPSGTCDKPGTAGEVPT